VGAGLVGADVPVAAGLDDDEHAAIASAQPRTRASLRIEGA
jgi:hypothetical protein